MEKEKIQKAVTDIRALAMTADEKRALYARITGSMSQPVHIRSYTTIVWRTFLVRQSWTSTLVVAALILMLAGGGVAFAAENTVPGDSLYPIKIDITEPLRETLAFSASAKAYMEELKIEHRIKEAATLAAEGKLTNAVNSQIQKNIEKSVKKVAELIGEAVN